MPAPYQASHRLVRPKVRRKNICVPLTTSRQFRLNLFALVQTLLPRSVTFPIGEGSGGGCGLVFRKPPSLERVRSGPRRRFHYCCVCFWHRRIAYVQAPRTGYSCKLQPRQSLFRLKEIEKTLSASKDCRGCAQAKRQRRMWKNRKPDTANYPQVGSQSNPKLFE